MKRAVLVLLAASALLRAGAEEAVIERLYAKLGASFTAAQALGQDGDYLLLAHPGFALDAAYLEDDYGISQLADQIPLAARYYQPSGNRCSSTYETILTQAEASNFVNQASRQAALQARRLMYDRLRPGRPTKAYEAYLKYQEAYLVAKDAYTLAAVEAKTSGTPVPPALKPAMDAALQAWEKKGGKALFEDAQKRLDGYYQENVKANFASLEGDLVMAARRDHGDTWYPVTATPPPREWLGDAGWKPFRMTQREANLAPATVALPLQARAGAPGQSLPGPFLSTLSLSLETKRVTFERTWLDAGVFTSRRWRLLPGVGFPKVSTGHPEDPDPGPMPLMITGVLLSRHMVLQGAWSQASAPGALKAIGPFAISAGSGDVPGRVLAAHTSVQNGVLTIRVDGPQILGFFCRAVPRCPDPDAKAFR